MARNDRHVIRYASGTGRNFGKAKNHTASWGQFREKFRKPLTTSERLKDYLKLPDAEQQQLKSINGWIYRTQVDGHTRNRRSGLPSDIITLDFDYATPEFFQDILEGRIGADIEFFIHTSRRHTPEKPRFRMFVPVRKPIPNDLYGPVSRIFARQIDPGMEFVDKVSFRPAQMMFMPTCSKDGEYVYHHNEGELLDWSEMLDIFELNEGDWRDITNLPKVEGEMLRKVADKAEIPTEKPGIVGDFCRAYDIHAAIAKFLPDIYAPVDSGTGKPRYTYLKGTTTNGAEVQDDGLFLYSHHGSDPCADMLVNAFDLVRIHLFGDKDTGDEMSKPISQRASFKHMVEFIKDDPGYREQVVKSRYDTKAMAADFTDDMLEGEVETDEDHDPEINDLVGPVVRHDTEGAPISPVVPTRKKRPEPPENWISQLELTRDGTIVSNAPNIAQIIQNDKRLRHCVEFNMLTGRMVMREPIKTRLSFVPSFEVTDKLNGTPLDDSHIFAIKVMLQAPNGPGKAGYGMKAITQEDLYGAVNMAARNAAFHPIREYLLSLRHDGRLRAESLFIEYCGCPDTPYYRAAARNFLLGAVARAFEPGHKFDFAPILAGGQGKRKSTMIRILAKSWYGELKADFSNENRLVEAMLNAWIMELPELSSIGRSRVEDVKAFISATESTVRLAWDRLPRTFPRQCVFIGSTNDDEYLIDATGNRRWWPIPVVVDQIDTEKLAANVDQIWAEMVAAYFAMRTVQPEGDLPLYLQDPEAQAEAVELQESARIETEVDVYAEALRPWLDRKIAPENFDDFDHANGSPKLARRRFVTVMEAWTEGLGMGIKCSPSDARAVGKALRKCGWLTDNKARRFGGKVTKAFIPGIAVKMRWAEEDEADLV